MPYINIAVAGAPLTKAQKQSLFDETTDLMAKVMGKNPTLTSVRIDEYPPENWAIGKTPVSPRNETAAHMDIKITAGTNTEDEKATMIESAMTMLKRVVDAVPVATYVIVHELDAGSWGYDGRTQADRTANQL
ncbi:MAG: tautomerase family protein [Rhodospirillales bacterium]|nr:tautomerase family protein [Rhodospirillales bacterium]